MQGKKLNRKKSAIIPEKRKKSVSTNNFIHVAIVLLYVLVELMPRLDAVDVMGSQWLFLSVLNCISTIYLLKNKIYIPDRFFKSAFFILYGLYIFISGLSFFVAYNVVESLVAYSRLLVCFIAFLNILTIIYRDNRVLKPLFFMIGLVVLYQSLEILIPFFSQFSKAKNLAAVINEIKGNTGNKNILAASIAIKVPFLIYAIHHSGLPGKLLYSIALMLSLVSLLIINARASYVSLFLELIIYLTLVTLLYFKSERKVSIFKLPGLVTLVFIVSVFIAQMIFSSGEKEVKAVGSYGGLAKRVETISLSNEGSSGRLRLWEMAFDFIKQNPVLGGGYGNWKIHSCKYEGDFQPGWGASMNHVHNDFLEAATDTGIPGGITYFSVFLCLSWFAFLIIRSREVSLEKKMFVAIAGMSLTAYAVDSFFNFPSERPNVHIFFSLSAAIISFGYLDLRRATAGADISRYYKKVLWVFVILSFFTLYVTLQVFKSMRIQDKISVEWIGLPRQARVPFKSEDINPYLPWIPNINGASMPVACIKAKYLCEEKRYDEALAILNADKGSNPYLYYAEFLRSMIALELNQNDSAYYYAKLAYYSRPAHLQLFRYFNELATDRKDTAELYKSFHEITAHYPRAELWVVFSKNLYACTGNDSTRMAVILDGLKKYPEDPGLLFQKYFLEGLDNFKKKSFQVSIDKFKEALKYDNEKFAKQNIGFAYVNLGVYNEAIPYFSDQINNKIFTDGKNEYYRGVCYENLNKKDSACVDFKNAKSMGYNVNPALLQSCQ